MKNKNIRYVVIGCMVLLSISILNNPGSGDDTGLPTGISMQVLDPRTIPTEIVYVQEVNTPDTWPRGLAFDGENMWHIGTDTGSIYYLNISNGAILDSFVAPSNCPFGLDYENEKLWYSGGGLGGCGADVMGLLNVSTGSLDFSYGSIITFPTDVEWVNDALIVGSWLENVMYRVNMSNGAIIGTISSPTIRLQGIAWDGNYLWIADSTDNQTIVRDIDHNITLAEFQLDYIPTGIEVNGSTLWIGDYTNKKIKTYNIEYATYTTTVTETFEINVTMPVTETVTSTITQTIETNNTVTETINNSYIETITENVSVISTIFGGENSPLPINSGGILASLVGIMVIRLSKNKSAK